MYELAVPADDENAVPNLDIAPTAHKLLNVATNDHALAATQLTGFVRNMQTLAMLDSVNLREFRTILAAEDFYLGILVDIAQIDPQSVIIGTAGDDEIIVTGNRSHYIWGLGGNDTIRITGSGRNTITPGTGNNVIYGGTGFDTYVIGRGYGFNRITANSGGTTSNVNTPRDRLVLTDGIRPDEVYFVRRNNNLYVYIWEKPLITAFAAAFNTAHLLPMELVGEEDLADFREIFESLTNRITFADLFTTNQRRRITDITFDCGTILAPEDVMARIN